MLQLNPDQPDRKTRILDAAERCFVRAGFHRTTMQDVAAEAGMSAGNLYRYFPSKDSVVEGLCERDRRELAADFARFDGSADILATLDALGRKHFVDEPREKAVLCCQIWAEAARSPAIAGQVEALVEDVTVRLTGLVEEARRDGRAAAGVEPRAAAILIATLADGLFVRRAVLPGFDAAREVPAVLALIGTILSGAAPPRPGNPREDAA